MNDFFKDIYYKELERKEHVNNRHNWSAGILIVIIGANIYCLNLLLKVNEFPWWILLIYGLTTITIIFSAIFLSIPMWAKKTKGFPKSHELKAYYKQLVSHYEPYEEKECLIKKAFDEYMDDIYITCADIEMKRSDSKIKYTVFGNSVMVISIVLIFITYATIVPMVINQEEIYEVEIVKGGENNE